MKNTWLKILIVGAVALSTLGASAKRSIVPVPGTAPAISHMVADGDIGDGTSPTKKG